MLPGRPSGLPQAGLVAKIAARRTLRTHVVARSGAFPLAGVRRPRVDRGQHRTTAVVSRVTTASLRRRRWNSAFLPCAETYDGPATPTVGYIEDRQMSPTRHRG